MNQNRKNIIERELDAFQAACRELYSDDSTRNGDKRASNVTKARRRLVRLYTVALSTGADQ